MGGPNTELFRSLIASTFTLASVAWGQVTLNVDVGDRVADMRNVIDFFELSGRNDLINDLKELRPRYQADYGTGGTSDFDRFNSFGLIPVANLHGKTTRTQARDLVNACKAKGVVDYQLWSEPNRTFGPSYNGSDNWLRSVTWSQFCAQAEQLYLGAKDADPKSVIHAPTLTGDHKNDPDWMLHLQQFVEYWIAKGHKLDYLNMNPPWDPRQVTICSNLARGYAQKFPALGLKGVSFGEWPFFVDALSTHVLFFIAFEESWNILYAAKSHFRQSSTNSGIIESGGGKKDIYWLFYQYARVTGKRLKTARSPNGAVAALSSYDEPTRAFHALVGNDQDAGETVALALSQVKGRAQATVRRFGAGGISQVATAPLTASGQNTMNLALGSLAARDAYHVQIVFEQAQDLGAATATLRPTAGQRATHHGHASVVPVLRPLEPDGQAAILTLTGRRVNQWPTGATATPSVRVLVPTAP